MNSIIDVLKTLLAFTPATIVAICVCLYCGESTIKYPPLSIKLDRPLVSIGCFLIFIGSFPLLVPKYIYTCGEYLKKVEGVSCGCIISLKTLFNKITGLLSCPQKFW